ncbi:hypothetical protein LJR034_008649 [Caballeronia sp. LjRoot34]|uniref:hypothetical protein n=1 Tax=Caballeronia sp. LjRoot34 TaxID=3342325 RepID=UPI003ECCD949
MKIVTLLARSIASGTGAALASAAVASREAVNNGASAVAPLNAVSHVIWPAQAFLEERPSLRMTGTGAFIHLGASIFWGALFETLLGRRTSAQSIVRTAAVTAVTAYVVDYHVVPERITPGFEAHVSPRSFVPIYAALGAGLALVALATRKS